MNDGHLGLYQMMAHNEKRDSRNTTVPFHSGDSICQQNGLFSPPAQSTAGTILKLSTKV